MIEPLNVIALISGGKDSFFSILHCMQNGHNVIAMANVYPVVSSSRSSAGNVARCTRNEEEREQDLNSFMFQTVGHTVIPLYEQALGIPLYRQPIVGSAVQTGTSYSHDIQLDSGHTPSGRPSEAQSEDRNEDETESLIPLLKRIMAEHPTANALSTGAILSTYQRTRIESVAIRLGLTPISYLWKFPILPPGTQTSLLKDMQAAGLDARIVKVASGGLDENFLWENVASESARQRIEKSMKRFGTDGDGAILGEGGEFETLVIDGPNSLFKGRIQIEEKNRKIVAEGGGSFWLRFLDAIVVMKTIEPPTEILCRFPDLLEQRFEAILDVLRQDSPFAKLTSLMDQHALSKPSLNAKPSNSTLYGTYRSSLVYWTFTAAEELTKKNISDETEKVIANLRQRLSRLSLDPTSIVSTVIILRSMKDFVAVNKVYGNLFTKPNPPARVTICCGDAMPQSINIMIHLKVDAQSQPSPLKKALHVQSRSYWAPANIGPYSQAISIPQNSANDQSADIRTISVAGQIPLIPSTMLLPANNVETKFSNTEDTALENFMLQTVLALQHLWRIGEEMEVRWWASAVAYIPRGSKREIAAKALAAARAWTQIHARMPVDADSGNDEARDLWEEKHYAGMEIRGGVREEKQLPEWSRVEVGTVKEGQFPPFFAVEVEELPRESGIEWHAHLGIIADSIKLDFAENEGFWATYQCRFGMSMQLVVMVSYSESTSEISRNLNEALASLGLDSEMIGHSYASYKDVSIEGLWSIGGFNGAVPCMSIWNNGGNRLAIVLLFDLTF